MFKAWFGMACGLIFCCAVASGETVKLKDGRTLEGKVINKGQTVTVIAGEKLYQFAKSQISTSKEKVVEGAKEIAAATGAKADTPKTANPIVKITTSKGDITVELFEDRVPNTVANIISLAESGFYKGMRFHRIIPGFMAQGGCPNSKEGARGRPGTGGPGYKIRDEIDPELRHDGPGILSMANSGPNTNGSQFFLCFKATPWLDGKHAVFGKVTAGLDVLGKLEALGSRSGQPSEQVEFNIEVVSKRDHKYEVKKL